jgi:hypothetical protein
MAVVAQLKPRHPCILAVSGWQHASHMRKFIPLVFSFADLYHLTSLFIGTTRSTILKNNQHFFCAFPTI